MSICAIVHGAAKLKSMKASPKTQGAFVQRIEAPPPPHTQNEKLSLVQVALLYLTRGGLFHEPTWKLWFEAAKSLVPIDPFKKAGCNSSVSAETSRYCFLDKGAGIIDQQILFNVYAHPAPSFPGFGEGSIFAGKEISNRVEVSIQSCHSHANEGVHWQLPHCQMLRIAE